MASSFVFMRKNLFSRLSRASKLTPNDQTSFTSRSEANFHSFFISAYVATILSVWRRETRWMDANQSNSSCAHKIFSILSKREQREVSTSPDARAKFIYIFSLWYEPADKGLRMNHNGKFMNGVIWAIKMKTSNRPIVSIASNNEKLFTLDLIESDLWACELLALSNFSIWVEKISALAWSNATRLRRCPVWRPQWQTDTVDD